MVQYTRHFFRREIIKLDQLTLPIGIHAGLHGDETAAGGLEREVIDYLRQSNGNPSAREEVLEGYFAIRSTDA